METVNRPRVKVSVVTVARNAAAGLARTVGSVVNQDYESIEFILIDGGSTDGTQEVIREYRDHFTFLVSEPDNGPYDAMNKGLARATGEWVIFMNAGDVFAGPGILSRILDSVSGSDDVIYGDCIADYGKFRVLRKAGEPSGLHKRMIFSHQSVLLRTALARQTGFNTDYRVSADYEMMLRLAIGGRTFRYLGEPVSVIEVQGISHRHMDQAAREHFRISSAYRHPGRMEKLQQTGHAGFLKMITFAYKMLPASVMLFMVKSVNRKNLVR
jgi:glycosyltransferase involved in cell wall biosynthesis